MARGCERLSRRPPAPTELHKASRRRSRQTHRERQATAGTALDRIRAIAADPHIYRIGSLIEEANRPAHVRGGRPRSHPDWCLVIFGACIRALGSASATERALEDPLIWHEVLARA